MKIMQNKVYHKSITLLKLVIVFSNFLNSKLQVLYYKLKLCKSNNYFPKNLRNFINIMKKKKL